MSRPAGVEWNLGLQMTGAAAGVHETPQRKQRDALRRCLRWFDHVREGAHVWPASALLTLGLVTMVIVWLCRMSTHNDHSSSLYLALKVETDLHDVITALRTERRCVTSRNRR